MIDWTVYDTRDGRILRSGSASDLATVYAQARELHEEIIVFTNATFTTHYVVDGVITPRPANPGFDKVEIVADGADVATMSLGYVFAAIVDGVRHEIADGTLEITSELPATYRVSVEAFPLLPYAAEIVASPAPGG